MKLPTLPHPASQILKVALTDLICTEPFWAYLALKLQIVADPSTPTAWVDGTTLGYNPDFVASLTQAQVRGLLAHQVAHCALGHPWRREARDGSRWNRATDYAVNGILSKAGFDLPSDALADPRYAGLSSEAIYGQLLQEDSKERQPQGGSGGDDSDPSGSPEPPQKSPEDFGEVRDAPGPSEQPESLSEDDWSSAVLTAERMAGKTPGGLDRTVTEARQPRCRSLIDAMLAWAERRSKSDYAWRRPSSRYAHLGLYLPSLESPSMPPVVAIVDTSGSVNAQNLATFEGALQRILDELSPESLIVISADTKVQRTDVYEPGDSLNGKYPGGGGTNFCPALREAMAHQPVGIVYLTDLCGRFPEVPPDVPVLWVVDDPRALRQAVPFGEAVYL